MTENNVESAEVAFDIVPMGAVRQNRSDAWKGRPVVIRYREYKDTLRILATMSRYTVPESDLSITFVLPMPSSWSVKKKEQMNKKPHQQKPDLDNLIKGFKDALCEDDSYVHHYGQMRKVWGEVGLVIVSLPPGPTFI